MYSTPESKRSRVAAQSKVKAKLYSWSRVKANIKQVNTLTEDEDRSTGYIGVSPLVYPRYSYSPLKTCCSCLIAITATVIYSRLIYYICLLNLQLSIKFVGLLRSLYWGSTQYQSHAVIPYFSQRLSLQYKSLFACGIYTARYCIHLAKTGYGNARLASSD